MNKYFFELLEQFVKLAEEQMMLPGFSEEDAPLPERQEEPFKFEEQQGWVPISSKQTVFENPYEEENKERGYYGRKESPYPQYMTPPTGKDQSFRLPSTLAFPELTLDNIELVIQTRELHLRSIDEAFKVLLSKKDEKEDPDHYVKTILDTYETARDVTINDKELVSKEEALKIYSEFRELYIEFYRKFRLTASKLNLNVNENEIYQQIKSLPLEEGLKLIPKVISAKAELSFNKFFVEYNRFVNSIFEQEYVIDKHKWTKEYGPKDTITKYKPQAFTKATNYIKRSLNQYENFANKILPRIKEMEKNINTINADDVKYLNNDDEIKDTIINTLRKSEVDNYGRDSSIFRAVDRLLDHIDDSGEISEEQVDRFNEDLKDRFIEHDVNRRVSKIRGELHTYFREELDAKIDEIFEKHGMAASMVKELYREYRKTQSMLETRRAGVEGSGESVEELEEKLNALTQKVYDLYDEVKKNFGQYFDFAKLEKMFDLGMLMDTKDIPERYKQHMLLGLKANALRGAIGFDHGYNDIFKHEAKERAVKLIREGMKEEKSSEEMKKEIDALTTELANLAVGWGFLKRMGNSGTATPFAQIEIEPDLAKLYRLTGGKFGPREVVPFIKEEMDGFIDGKTLQIYIKESLKNHDFNKSINLLDETSGTYAGAIIANEILKRNNNLSGPNLYRSVKEMDDYFGSRIANVFRLLPKDMPHKEKYKILSKFFTTISGKDKEKLSNELSVASRSIDDIHNYGDDLDKDTITDIINNSNTKELKYNIPQKIHEAIIKLYNAGGKDKFFEKYSDPIKYLKEVGAINSEFENNVEKFISLYENEEYVKISDPMFSEYSGFINSIYKDVNTILNYETFKKYYTSASKPENKKVPELFDINYQVNDYLRFRVLKDLDPQYFEVGIETDCCQSVGGAGEEAAIDSFINPYAAVVVLETKNNGNWETAAQSYFHYVSGGNGVDPKDGEIRQMKGGYILDNVEVADKYSDGIESPSGHKLSIESIYAYWANKLDEKLDIDYLQSGLGYSDIDSNKFNAIYFEDDPREFSVDDPYTDWERGDNIDLLNFTDEIVDVSKVANVLYFLSNKFLKNATPIEENLKDYLAENPNQYQTMEQIDTDSFSKYQGGYGQDAEDIEDDFQQPGAQGIGLTDDNGNIVGYVYGYNMTGDEVPDIHKNTTTQELVEEYGVKFFKNVPDNFYKQLLKQIKKKRVFYISNLALPSQKIKLASMLKALVSNLKGAGYEYVTFDGLSDTMNLFMGEGFEPKLNRLGMFGLDLIALIPDGDGFDHAQALMELK